MCKSVKYILKKSKEGDLHLQGRYCMLLTGSNSKLGTQYVPATTEDSFLKRIHEDGQQTSFLIVLKQLEQVALPCGAGSAPKASHVSLQNCDFTLL